MTKKKSGYSDAIQELESIVAKIESEEVDVDELAENVKKALQLIKTCNLKLKNTEEEVSRILKEIGE
ncbi:MAG: exodeoxyribonuclease VII small subunit [Bacteroidetes bacterium]|nr:exodeoxyribonuclease VII small subunit [Bacteroidota bacterium]